MLHPSLLDPVDQHWGYSVRVYNMLYNEVNMVTSVIASLQTLITMPTPLPYFQHCKVMLMVFACAYPLSIDPAEGILDNIVMPFLIFWAISGFEVLAQITENPLGQGSTDLNLFEAIHHLECFAEV